MMFKIIVFFLFSFGKGLFCQSLLDFSSNHNVVASLSFASSDNKKKDDEKIVGAGLGAYFIGAVGGYLLVHNMITIDSTLASDTTESARVRRYLAPLHIVGVTVGGSVLSSVAVYVGNHEKGNLPAMIGGAVLSQAVLAIGITGTIIIVREINKTFIGKTFVGNVLTYVTSMGAITTVLAAPFAATLTANYVSHHTR